MPGGRNNAISLYMFMVRSLIHHSVVVIQDSSLQLACLELYCKIKNSTRKGAFLRLLSTYSSMCYSFSRCLRPTELLETILT